MWLQFYSKEGKIQKITSQNNFEVLHLAGHSAVQGITKCWCQQVLKRNSKLEMFYVTFKSCTPVHFTTGQELTEQYTF